MKFSTRAGYWIFFSLLAFSIPVSAQVIMESGNDKASISPKLQWSIGAQISRVVNVKKKNDVFDATGLGINLKMERAISQKFKFTAGVNFDYFFGRYTSTIYRGGGGDTTVNRFAIAPVFVGAKYCVRNNFYLSAEIGPALKASSITRTKLALAPSIGMLLPLANHHFLDIGLRYTHIVKGYGIPESISLQNGGYGFVSIRASYGTSGKR